MILWNIILFWTIAVVSAQDPALLREYARASNASLQWAPYRSNLYFGVKPRGIPYSLQTGLMWYNGDSFLGLQDLRHSCEPGDDMAGFGWTSYDPRVGGSQIIRDRKNNVDITTEFVKTESGNWAVRVKGKPLSANTRTVMVFYAALEGSGELDLASELTPTGLKGETVSLKGKSPELDRFRLDIKENKKKCKHPKDGGHPVEKSKPADNFHYASLTVADGSAWMVKDIFLTLAQDRVGQLSQLYGEDETLPPHSVYLLSDSVEVMKGRMHLVQKVFEGSFEFDVLYNTEGTDDKISTKKISDMVDGALDTVDKKFKESFEFAAPYNTEKYLPFAKEMYSSLVGGMGYFYGKQMVNRAGYDEEDEENFWENDMDKSVVEEGPHELLTLVPSRSFFPRGFYWDEGFQLIPVLEYDPDLVLEIMKSWLNQVDGDGWIARELILGPEARSKVPQEFQTQYPNYANPPTLMLLLSRIVTKVHNSEMKPKVMLNNDASMQQNVLGNSHIENPDLLMGYVKQIYPNLQTHYDWFRSTQRGNLKEFEREAFSLREGYRWRGRTPSHCLTSGLDDYPRAVTPHTGELHVDLISWIGMFTRAMKDFALVLGEKEDAEEYSQIENAIIQNIDDLHWDEEEGCHCDSTIDEFGEDVHVCHKGYVSLFPFLLQLIPEDKRLEKRALPIIDMIRDPEHLWTEFGLRSLSKSDEYFGTNENYWRGPIWMNINYMALESLQYYAAKSKTIRAQAAPVYKELRQNLVDNVFREWERTGFAWEQYDSTTGKGQGVRNFLGWTSLVVNIMAMPETI